MNLTRDDLLKLPPQQLRYLIWRKKWLNTAREKQLPPATTWTELGVLAGRGFGKTLMGAQWIANKAYSDPRKLARGVIAPVYEGRCRPCWRSTARP